MERRGTKSMSMVKPHMAQCGHVGRGENEKNHNLTCGSSMLEDV